eukprot:NODE_128_length_2425_cov_83.743687_g111_i0.p1 GENE.NODE_128_length_2425_cov_83.743687_g111_i0~~NODE_128_length_2425_cov_83.743687_g111_i0.p1  ORF type:complete len:289 (-),score=78.72 NODE_128_length_2425_cov_83.743687_g111_i0:207-1073(-)
MRNTGHTGGMFLQRQRVKKPVKGNETLSREAPYYLPGDFYVGAEVNINSHIIHLDQIDEHTVKYMEGRSEEFDVSHVEEVLRRLRVILSNRFTQLTDAFRYLDRDHDGQVSIEELSQACVDLNLPLVEHELMTLMRHLDINGNGMVEQNELVRMTQLPDYGGDLEKVQEFERVTDHHPDLPSEVHRGVLEQTNVAAECDRVFQLFREKVSAQKTVFLDTFRLMSDRSPDSTIGRAQFLYVVNTVLQMNLPPDMLQLLVNRFFPYERTRLNLRDFRRLLDTVPHFEKRL